MKFDEILRKHGQIPRKMAEQNLTRLGNKLFGKSNWEFIDGYDSETVSSKSGKAYKVGIAKNFMTDGCGSSEWNKAGYVLAVKDMYHEYQHVRQNTKAWNDTSDLKVLKSYKKMTNIVRREFIKEFFPSVYYNQYSNNPGEMNSEFNGLSSGLTHFQSDSVVDDVEAGEILYEWTTSEDYVHEELLQSYKEQLRSIHDVFEFFKKRDEACADDLYKVTTDINPMFKDDPDLDLSFTKEFLHDIKFWEYRRALKKCTTGIEQDKILEQAILFAYPDIIKQAPPRLRKELLACKDQMKFGTVRPGSHAVNPKHINYSISENTEISLTNNDLTGLSTDTGPVL